MFARYLLKNSTPVLLKTPLSSPQTAFLFSKVKELLKEDQWDALIAKNPKPVIIDFYADWCGPCKKLGPLLEKHLENSNDKFDIVKINIDNHGDIANSFKVSSIPSVFLVHNNKTVDQFLGLNEPKLTQLTNKAKALAEAGKQ